MSQVQVANNPVWRSTGVEIENGVVPQEFMFGVNQKPVYHHMPDGSAIEIPSTFILERDDTHAPLSIVGKRYQPYLNKDMFEIVERYVETTGGVFERAGFYAPASYMWAVVRHDEYEVVTGDPITKYDVFINPFRNGYAFTLATTDIRIVCGNAMSAIMSGSRGVQSMYKIHHSKSVAGQVKIAAEASAATTLQRAQQIELMKSFAAKKVRAKDIDQFANMLFDVDAEGNCTPAKTEKVELFKSIIENGMGADLKGVRGTVYGMYQAAIEYADHYMKIKDDNARLDSLFSGTILMLKQKAAALAIDLVAA